MSFFPWLIRVGSGFLAHVSDGVKAASGGYTRGSKIGQDGAANPCHPCRMNDARNSEPDFLAEVLGHIERHLFTDLTVEQLARVAGLSPYHFSRAFTARLGESAMGYVRQRRLDHAAFRLSGSAPPTLVDLAFHCRFESQEAFTRAFRRRFGVPPGRFKREAQKHPFEGNKMSQATAPVDVQELDQLLKRDSFLVVGVRAVFDGENKHGIPALWPRLLKCLPLPGQVDGRSYGVCWSDDPKQISINYMAGVEVRGQHELPAGFERLEIAPQSYAVFRVTIDGPNLHPQLQAAMPLIWGNRRTKSGLKFAQAPDFELYPEGFDPMRKGAHIDICVPVET
jgi:AraC family transcriptional regulator